VLSAICIYAPCRWLYRPVAAPTDVNVRKYLPYLYLLFAATLPVQIIKNYRYYEYAQQHGGYIFIYVNHAALASSVPFWVRAIPLITLPAFVAIFVFERRRLPLYLATFLYFVSASLTLLLGSRGGPFMLIASLWWAARVKSLRKTRIAFLAIAVLILLIIGNAIQETRQTGESEGEGYSLVHLIATQGISLNVTEVAFKYRHLFAPYTWSYLLTELQNAFVANDVVSYQRGKSLAIDISVFLDPEKYRQGHGTASSYIAEAYVAGGIIVVILVSVVLGLGLHALYRFSVNSMLLFVMALCLPDILLMPKGQLLDWVSVLVRNGIGVALLWIGWKLYALLLSIRRTSSASSEPGIATA
jgi:oligosaccharide repeat unit polymerase